jgi:hypothetical protein
MLFGLIYHQDQARRNVFKSTEAKPIPVLICTSFLKHRVIKIEFDEPDFFVYFELDFTACVAIVQIPYAHHYNPQFDTWPRLGVI